MMSNRKLNAEQAGKIRQLKETHSRYVIAKAEMRNKIEAEYEKQLQAWEFSESRLMNEALKLGVPKTEIGRAVGTSNWETLKAKYELTSEEFLEAQKTLTVDHKNRTITVDYVDYHGQRFEGPLVLSYLQNREGAWISVDTMDAGHGNQLQDFLFDALYIVQIEEIIDLVASWDALAKEFVE